MNEILNELIRNIHYVDNLDKKTIEDFNRYFFRKRLPPEIRPAIKKRETYLSAVDRAKSKTTNWIERLICSFHRVSHLHYKSPLTPDQIKYHGRSIANDIHDFPTIPSGFESKKSLELRKCNEKYVPCQEHFYPRQLSGERIIRIVEETKGGTFKEFAQLMCNSCKVNWVTPEENMLLCKYQTADRFESPEQSYKNAGIELIKVKDVVFEFNPWYHIIRAID